MPCYIFGFRFFKSICKVYKRNHFFGLRFPDVQSDRTVSICRRKRVNITNYLIATDKLNGDISNSIQVTDTNIDFDNSGNYNISINASNSFGDISEISFPVHIIKQIDSVFKINLTQNVLYLNRGEEFDPARYIKDITSLSNNSIKKNEVKIQSFVNTDKPGNYEVKYTVENNGGFGVTYLNVIVI